MTDTTDAALRDQFKSIRDDVKFYEGTQHCIAVPIKLAKALLDQLEAERQRADDAERANRQQKRDLESGQTVNKVLQAELAALKGDQVPVAFTGSGSLAAIKGGHEGHIWGVPAEAHPVPLYDRPKNPVVHPDTKRMNWLVSQHVEVRTSMVYGSHARFVAQCDSDDCEEYHTTLREQVDAAIEAAGGIVKDGE